MSRRSESVNGEFSPRIDKKTADRIKRYCNAKNINKSTFVCGCVNEKLDMLEKEYYSSLSKEQLVDMILAQRT